MRHGMYGRTLGRRTNHRIAMWRNMATALFTHNQITTTIPKAKSLAPFVEKLITLAKKGDLASRRRAIAQLGGDVVMIKSEDDEGVTRNKYGEVTGGKKIVKHLFDEIAPRYADRTGGYTRIIKLGIHRIGDGSDLCVIQLVGTEEQGPQVSGKNSRRRDKANRRMDFAAKLRKGDTPAPGSDSDSDSDDAQAPAQQPASTPDAQTDDNLAKSPSTPIQDPPTGNETAGDESGAKGDDITDKTGQ